MAEFRLPHRLRPPTTPERVPQSRLLAGTGQRPEWTAAEGAGVGRGVRHSRGRRAPGLRPEHCPEPVRLRALRADLARLSREPRPALRIGPKVFPGARAAPDPEGDPDDALDDVAQVGIRHRANTPAPTLIAPAPP